MRILIISDTHRHNENYFKVLEKVGPFDMVIHCGDAEGSEYTISEGAGCETIIVLGNNDFFSALPREVETQIGKYKVLITHGHTYYVSTNRELIKQDAAHRGFDIVMYGHTHRPVIDIGSDVIAINPGSLSYPRQDGHKPSYIIMEIDRFGEAHFTLNYL